MFSETFLVAERGIGYAAPDRQPVDLPFGPRVPAGNNRALEIFRRQSAAITP